MTTLSRTRILIVDDNQLTRLGIAALIETQPDLELVGEATDGARAVTMWTDLQPDVALVDLRLPIMDGVQVIELARKRAPDVRALVLSHYDGDENIFRALRAGAYGYLTKDAPGEQILEAIRSVAAGKRTLPPDIAAQLAARSGQAELTVRELQVLALIATGASNRDIADQLAISERTATTHTSNILGKLGAKSRTEAVAIATQRGLVPPRG
jgi:DNA-binding NarL/FixJ family response regulator